MADEPDTLMLQDLRGVDTKVDRLAHDVRHVQIRWTAVGEGFAVFKDGSSVGWIRSLFPYEFVRIS